MSEIIKVSIWRFIRLFGICLYIFFLQVMVVHAQDNPVHDKKDDIIIDRIVVTSDRMQDYVENHPEAVQSLDMEEMEKSGYMALGDALNTLSGVEVKENSGSLGARVMIRGNSDVFVLVDGRSWDEDYESHYGYPDNGVRFEAGIKINF